LKRVRQDPPPLLFADNDAPLIDERAATRERSAMERGEARGGVKIGCPFEPAR
jgi:hypothetical protein